MNNAYFLNENFDEQIQQNSGVMNTSAIRINSVELRASEGLKPYAEQIAQKVGLTVETVVADGMFYNTHTIKGIDPILFDELNETLPVPIDRESFDRGGIVIINAAESSLLGCFDGVSALEIKREADTEYKSLAIGGIVQLPATQADTSFQYSDMEILVSNSFLEQYINQPKFLSLGINVENDYEETLYNAFKALASDNSVSMVSRYEGRQSMQDAKAIMLVLGGGISFILGFIGVFNYINVMSVGIMSRKHELAALVSIGMSKRQLRTMLRCEGLGYAAVTLFL